MLSPITYHGKVTFKVGNQSYQLTNNGTTELFSLICRLLAGESSESTALPRYLDLRNDADQTILNDLLFSIPQFINGPIDDGIDRPYVSISASLTRHNLQANITNNNKNLFLVLLDSKKIKLATVTIASNLINQIKTGRQGYIEWKLYFNNKSTGNNSGEV